MEHNGRRNFLRKAAVSLAAIGAFGGRLPAFGAAFVSETDALGNRACDARLGAFTTITIVTWVVTYHTVSSTSRPQVQVDQVSMADTSSGSYLNLGS